MSILIFALSFLAMPTHANNEVLSDGSTSFNDVVNDGMLSSHTVGDKYSLRYRFYCFGHNLRGKPAVNVASADANLVKYRPEHDGDQTTRYEQGTLTVETRLKFHDDDQPANTMTFEIPVTMGEYHAEGEAGGLTFNPSVSYQKRLASHGNLAQVDISTQQDFVIPEGASMPTEADALDVNNPVKRVRLLKDGDEIYQRTNVRANADGSIVNIYMGWPGKDGPCHNYYSPLMLFTDAKRPLLKGESQFKLAGMPGVSFWVEPNAPGEFLALDVNGNGKIDDYTELFSESKEHPNGFETLKMHDTNKDGVIDKKDKVFGKLLMWHDKNGDGISQKEEMTNAKKRGLVSIKLDYVGNVVTPVGYRGEYRERSRYQYKTADGKVKTGEIIDVWFGRKSSKVPVAKND